MASSSLARWRTSRAQQLDEIEAAHAAVGGTKRGRRWATREVNHAYTVMISSQFQGFCRDLHSESIDYIVSSVRPASLQNVLRAEFTLDRKLDRGNPNPGNVGSDYGRLGVSLWPRARARDSRTSIRMDRLEELSAWRNAIAHQDFAPKQPLEPATITLKTVKQWRRSCNGLAGTFDRVMSAHVAKFTGTAPW